jgi:hypothetical protein
MFETLKCKNHRYASCWHTQDAYLPAITACNQGIRDAFVPITNVKNVSINVEAESLSISWTPDDIYFTEIQIRYENGEWETLALGDPGESEL